MSVRGLFPHSSKTNRDFFEIEMANDQVWPGIGHSTMILKFYFQFGCKCSKWLQKTSFLPVTGEVIGVFLSDRTTFTR